MISKYEIALRLNYNPHERTLSDIVGDVIDLYESELKAENEQLRHELKAASDVRA